MITRLPQIGERVEVVRSVMMSSTWRVGKRGIITEVLLAHSSLRLEDRQFYIKLDSWPGDRAVGAYGEELRILDGLDVILDLA